MAAPAESRQRNELTNALLAAKDALKPALAGLLLPEDTTVAVARARMVEFEDLLAKDRLRRAQATSAPGQPSDRRPR